MSSTYILLIPNGLFFFTPETELFLGITLEFDAGERAVFGLPAAILIFIFQYALPAVAITFAKRCAGVMLKFHNRIPLSNNLPDFNLRSTFSLFGDVYGYA